MSVNRNVTVPVGNVDAPAGDGGHRVGVRIGGDLVEREGNPPCERFAAGAYHGLMGLDQRSDPVGPSPTVVQSALRLESARFSIGMTLARSLLRPSSVHRRARPLPLASETNALRQPRAFNFCGTLMNAKTIVAALPAAELAKVDSECSPTPIESPVAHGVWTHDVEALCRALAAQQRAHFPSPDAEEK
jgi:hypothetical protein